MQNPAVDRLKSRNFSIHSDPLSLLIAGEMLYEEALDGKT
jgi:hypothetical protein